MVGTMKSGKGKMVGGAHTLKTERQLKAGCCKYMIPSCSLKLSHPVSLASEMHGIEQFKTKVPFHADGKAKD